MKNTNKIVLSGTITEVSNTIKNLIDLCHQQGIFTLQDCLKYLKGGFYGTE